MTATVTGAEGARHAVRVARVEPVALAVVRRVLRVDELQAVWPAALDEVWAFVRGNGVKAGRNVLVYRDFHDGVMTLEAGVEVSGQIPPDGHVFGSATPGGRAAMVEHRGGYEGIPLAHAAIREHCAAVGLAPTGPSWEVYGHYPTDQTPPVTEVFYLLAD